MNKKTQIQKILNDMEEHIKHISAAQEEQKIALLEMDNLNITKTTEKTTSLIYKMFELEERIKEITGHDSIDDFINDEDTALKEQIKDSLSIINNTNVEIQIRMLASQNVINNVLVASGIIENQTTYDERGNI